MSDKKLLSVKQAAKELNVHWQTVRNYIDRGELKANKIGKLIRISRENLKAFIEGNKNVTKKMELELRYKINESKQIQKKLLDMGAKQIQQTHIIDHWFIPMHIQNMEEEIEWFDKKRGTGIRIREYINEYGNIKSLALETKRLTLDMNHNTFLESSMPVQDFDKTVEFLEAIDRKEYLTIDKNRIIYSYDIFQISLDTIKNFKSGVEIEYSGPELNRNQVIKKIKELASELGLKDSHLFEKSLTVDAMDKLAKF